MNKYSLSEFISKTAERDASQEMFELESPHLLEVKLNGKIWAKAGSMIAYIGKVGFKR